MKSLYNEDDRYNKEGQELSNRVDKVLQSIFIEYVDRGYSIRDIAGIMKMSVVDIETGMILDQDSIRSESPITLDT